MTQTADPPLTTESREALAELLLSIADDEFVIGFWDSEWTGIAPMLEEDVATSSISQDEIGHAKALYELLAELTSADADQIAFGRSPDAYRHAALMNHARTDWAFSIARRYLYETADAVRLEALARSSYQPLAQLVAKMRREERYHQMHLDAWLHRLAADDASHERLARSLSTLVPDALTIFTPLAGEAALLSSGILPEPMAALRARWVGGLAPVMAQLGLPAPSDDAPATDGRTRRTDDFRWLHGEFTMVARSEEAATW
ncbi:MAG: phenylacetate-CoA oxygenase subunit PaaC [Chloroflexota bacterium]|nr:phenylacetate-CoA oxygenase subunit PaaC [Chloroflexota bacterium]